MTGGIAFKRGHFEFVEPWGRDGLKETVLVQLLGHHAFIAHNDHHFLGVRLHGAHHLLPCPGLMRP